MGTNVIKKDEMVFGASLEGEEEEKVKDSKGLRSRDRKSMVERSVFG